MTSQKLINLYYKNRGTLNINIIFEKFNSGGLNNLNHRGTLFNYHLYEREEVVIRKLCTRFITNYSIDF